MTTRLLFTAIGLGAAFLAWDWFSSGYVIVAVLIGIIACAWIYAEVQRVNWAAYAALISAVASAIAANQFGLSPAWLLPGLAFILAAWDLANFARRLDFGAQPEDRAALEWNHLIRLGSVLLIGLVLSGVTLNLTNIHITFEWIVVSIAIGAWGLMALIGWLRGRGNMQL